MSLDIMLPALPDIGLALAASSSNLGQLTVGAFLLGAAISSFIVGPVADRYGRRPPILCGLVVFVLASLLTPLAHTMEMMLILRFIQGAGVGTTRLSQAILRDHYSGSAMARAMSLVLTVFLIMPVLAPLVGQAVLIVGGWRAIFFTMAVFGLVVLVWTWWRLPEMLAPTNRRPLSFGSVWSGLATIAADRSATGYGLAYMLLLGTLYGFIATAQPLYGQAYGLGDHFALAMAGTAIVQSIAAFVCSHLIPHFGPRAVGMTGLATYVGFAAVALIMLYLDALPFWLLLLIITAMMTMFTWADATLGALSMMNLGKIAGTAASAFGAIQQLGGTLLGSLIAQCYDGTPRALFWGSVILGVIALGSALWAGKSQMR
ncbi:DHA1 family bicyclomycin/chloramphenicol resistance-like MFS transporter [Agrobacterium larrymoorei]|uniref:DHA1 family bicyclomycin/chloramphenicol resistance-like MFS transporter n=2 Tax=Agrobacterium larrymoorei TaxID=160699 RepID=A0AAJ2ES05_9HYPH|nr:DHA1 family bicyclomycin/chloramphenicol resistance-like MFS transporter [Agrobacterium larrymoorei]